MDRAVVEATRPVAGVDEEVRPLVGHENQVRRRRRGECNPPRRCDEPVDHGGLYDKYDKNRPHCFGRQCNTVTCRIHSVNGCATATMPTATRSAHRQPAITMRTASTIATSGNSARALNVAPKMRAALPNVRPEAE